MRPGRLAGGTDSRGRATVDDGASRTASVVLPWPLVGRPPSGTRAMLVDLLAGDDAAIPVAQAGQGSAGDAGIRSAHGSQVVCRDGRIEASDTVRAPGYECGQQAGVSGTLTITASDHVVTITIAGGIIVAVTATGTAVWTPGG